MLLLVMGPQRSVREGTHFGLANAMSKSCDWSKAAAGTTTNKGLIALLWRSRRIMIGGHKK